MSELGGAAVPLTADLCARAIIAAARAYGDDPVKACLASPKSNLRRALSAAAGGLHRAADLNLKAVCGVLTVRPMTVYTARSKKGDAFRAAETAAMRAVEFALWRPEAAESVVAGDADDWVEASTDIELPNPAGETIPASQGNASAAEAETGDSPVTSAATADAPQQAEAANLERLRQAVRAQPRDIPITTRAEPLARRAAATAPARAEAPARPRQAGPISGPIAPARFTPPAPAAETPVTDLVLAALADGGARDSMNLASMIDRKELAVVSALNQLKSERKVVDEPIKEGPRRFRWRLVA